MSLLRRSGGCRPPGAISSTSSATRSTVNDDTNFRCTRGSTSVRVSDACSVSSSLKIATRWWSNSSRISARSTGWICGSFSFNKFNFTFPSNLPMSCGNRCTDPGNGVVIDLRRDPAKEIRQRPRADPAQESGSRNVDAGDEKATIVRGQRDVIDDLDVVVVDVHHLLVQQVVAQTNLSFGGFALVSLGVGNRERRLATRVEPLDLGPRNHQRF